MVKALFVVGQCIRLLHTDPWQAPTLKIEDVGQYSYRASVAQTLAPDYTSMNEYEVISFEDQKEYSKVSCPTKEDK